MDTNRAVGAVILVNDLLDGHVLHLVADNSCTSGRVQGQDRTCPMSLDLTR